MSVDATGTDLYADGGWLSVVICALLIIAITFVVSEVLVFIFRRIYHAQTDGDKAGSIVKILIRSVIWVIGIYFLAKICLDVDLGVFIGALGVGGIALSLGLQDTIGNLLGGIQITVAHDWAVGDWVKVDNVEGVVKDVSIRTTTLVDDIGQTHIVPNKILNSSTVTVMPKYFRVPMALVLKRECDFDVEVPAVCKIADDALAEKGMLCEGCHCALVQQGVGANGINATLVAFSTWDFSSAEVTATVMHPVVKYLQDQDLLSRWQ